ncbi:hypothetical protein JCM12296A_25860 [Desulfosarcina cetonica]
MILLHLEPSVISRIQKAVDDLTADPALASYLASALDPMLAHWAAMRSMPIPP